MDRGQPEKPAPCKAPKDDLRQVHPEDEERGQQIDPDRPNDRDD